MPTISVKADLLFCLMNKTYTEEEFADLCFDYGLELDEVTTEKQMISKEKGSEKSEGASEDIIYRIDIPANRYDLLCVEGLSRALLIFEKRLEIPKYVCLEPKYKLVVDQSVKSVRPYCVAAILRDITFTPERYASFIDLQDKLHQNLGRMRKLVSIGTHDLDKISTSSNFVYKAVPPQDISFVPLNQTQLMDGPKIMEFYADTYIKPFLSIIKDKDLYPLICDSNGDILSLPPIINGDMSKISLNTKNVFIEITATDFNKANIVLDTILTMFSQHCEIPYTAEAVTIEDGENIYQSPKLHYSKMDIKTDVINKYLGFSLVDEEVKDLLCKMSLKTVVNEEGVLDVEIPPTRQDIIHACDLIEDAAIAYGYNNIELTLPKNATIASELPINKLTDHLRHEIAYCGFTEALTFSLCSREDISDKIRKKDGLEKAVLISNPKTVEFQVARTCLLPGLLKTIYSNKKVSLPIKLFEISDIVLKDSHKEVQAANLRNLAVVYYNKQPGFEVIHGILDRLMQVLAVPHSQDSDKGYYIRPASDSSYLDGRCAEVVVHGVSIGKFGVLHPDVVTKFELSLPCSALELCIESFA